MPRQLFWCIIRTAQFTALEALMPRRGFDWGDQLLRGWRSAQHCILHEESEDRSICNVEAFSPGKKDQILVVFNRSPF